MEVTIKDATENFKDLKLKSRLEHEFSKAETGDLIKVTTKSAEPRTVYYLLTETVFGVKLVNIETGNTSHTSSQATTVFNKLFTGGGELRVTDLKVISGVTITINGYK